MICRFCGKKTESVLECPHCSHETPVVLSYRSYISDPIIDKLRSVLLSPPQKDETSSNSFPEPILLDTESSLQKLQCGSATVERVAEDVVLSEPRIDIDKEESGSKQEADSATAELSEPVAVEQAKAGKTTEVNVNSVVSQQEDQFIGEESAEHKTDEEKTSESSGKISKLKLFVSKHILLACAILICVSLVIGFAVGYSVGKHDENDDIPAESDIQNDETYTTTISEQTIDTTNDLHSTVSNADAHTAVEATDEEAWITERVTSNTSDYSVSDAVLREKESEEIQ